MIRATASGWRAHAALMASGGVAKVIAPLSHSYYAEAAGELIWIGEPNALLHPRAVLAPEAPVPPAAMSINIALGAVAPWRPATLCAPLPRPRDGARLLYAAFVAIGKPRGLVRVFATGGEDDLVTTQARPHIAALARASAADDAAAFADAARPLLGLGTGLTPSCDDFVGGALFARRVFLGMDPTWDAAVARIVADAAYLTHPISARLLADLAGGEGWAPLHELASAFAADDLKAAVAAARRVKTLGHTSGWDLLAGTVASLGGSAAKQSYKTPPSAARHKWPFTH